MSPDKFRDLGYEVLRTAITLAPEIIGVLSDGIGQGKVSRGTVERIQALLDEESHCRRLAEKFADNEHEP